MSTHPTSRDGPRLQFFLKKKSHCDSTQYFRSPRVSKGDPNSPLYPPTAVYAYLFLLALRRNTCIHPVYSSTRARTIRHLSTLIICSGFPGPSIGSFGPALRHLVTKSSIPRAVGVTSRTILRLTSGGWGWFSKTKTSRAHAGSQT